MDSKAVRGRGAKVMGDGGCGHSYGFHVEDILTKEELEDMNRKRAERQQKYRGTKRPLSPMAAEEFDRRNGVK
jgi:hypothetical protein